MKKRILTGITTTGTPHIGNYIGAIRPAIEMTKDSDESFFFLADYHSIIKNQDSDSIKNSVKNVALAWLSSGLDPNKSYFYKQSDVPEIIELCWILNCVTAKGFMNRAHAYKAATSINENDPDKGNIFNVLSSINEEGYSSVTMVVGSDRVAEFNDLLQKYNGQAYNFEELKVVSGGQRDPDAEGVEGMSASKMRAFAAEGNLEDFAKGIPGKDEGVAKRLMDAVRKGMGIQEKEDVEIKELWQIAPKLDLQNLREAYVQKSIFDIGTVVEHLDTGVQGKIVHRGTNYAIFEDGNGWRFRCWLTSLNEVREKHHSADDGSGNDWKIGTDTYRQAVQAMTPGQSVKKFSDFRKSK